MMKQARNAGATWSRNARRCLLLVLPLLAALPAAGADLRLTRAHAALLRTTTLGPTASAGPQDTLRLELEAGGERYALQLRPKTHLGLLATRLRNRAVAYEGSLVDRPGSWAAITRVGNRWAGLWFDGQHYFGLDSAAALAAISGTAAAADPETTVVFRLSDALWTDVDLHGDTRPAVRSAEDFIDLVASELSAPTSLLATLPDKRLAMALLADPELARQDGAQAEANMLAQLNIVDGIFANQVGVRLQSGNVSIFNAGNSPFTDATSSETLLTELRDFRASSPQQRTYGLSHLFTGRNLDGTTVGIAYLDSLCSNTYSASVSEARREISFAALIAAHEIGHVFGAPHDAESGSACEAEPARFLMAPQLNINNQTFSACSVEKMSAVIARAACLAPTDAADALVEAPPPVVMAVNRATDVTIAVRSVGNTTVNGLNLRITLPLTFTLLDANGPAATCSNTANVVNCALGNLAPNTATAVTLRVLAPTVGSASAALRLTAANDALRSNDVSTIQFQVADGTDLALTGMADTLALDIGGTSTATFDIENRSGATAADARISVTIPVGLTATIQSTVGTVCAPVTEGITCGPTALTVGATARVVLSLRADAAGSHVISAGASSSRPELVPADNTAAVTLTVRSPTPPPSPPATTGGGKGGGGSMTLDLLAGLALWSSLALRRRCARASGAGEIGR